MSKVFGVAWAEFQVAVRSKAFIAGIVLLPLIWGAAILIPKLLEDKVDTAPRAFAVVDPTGQFHDLLVEAAAKRDEAFVFEGEGRGSKAGRAAFRARVLRAERRRGPQSGALRSGP